MYWPDNKMTAIRASFADWRPVKSRSVLQLILEVPIEQTEAVLGALGAPLPGKETWVGVALLRDEAAPVAQPGIIEEGAKAAVTRAAMLCQDKAFQEWFMGPVVPGNAASDTAAFMRTYLCVASRSEIATNPVVLRRFLDLERQYQEAMASA